MRETFEQLIARINANAFVPNLPPTAGEKREIVMPKSVKITKGKEFTFSKPGVQSKYAWDTWFNPNPKDFPGGLVLLERSDVDKESNLTPGGEKRDYEVSTDSMLPKIKTAARKRYKIVQVSKKDADGNKLVDALILKARDMMADERAAEDILRAEEKAARKAAKEEEDEDDGDDQSVPMQQQATA